MTDGTFVDTNILVYAHDIESREKNQVARDVLRELRQDATGIVSPQVLQEFYITVTRKIGSAKPKQDARLIVNTYATWCMQITSADILSGYFAHPLEKFRTCLPPKPLETSGGDSRVVDGGLGFAMAQIILGLFEGDGIRDWEQVARVDKQMLEQRPVVWRREWLLHLE